MNPYLCRAATASLLFFMSVTFLANRLNSETSGQSKADSRPVKRDLNGPDCSGGWPTDMAFALLKNAGIVNSEDIEFSKTQTSRIASQKIGKNLYHQVYQVAFTRRSGETIESIAVHDASQEECSM